MYTTSFTLLQKLRDLNNDAAWDRFVDLYSSLLCCWARKLPLRGADPDDLVQGVFLKLVKELPQFCYDPAKGGFRKWLRTVCHNHWRDHQRKRANHLDQAAEGQLTALPADDTLEQFWNRDYNALLAREAYRILEEEIDPLSRAAFTGMVMEERSAADVAKQLGITTSKVYMRKFRVVRRLREELAEFLEE